MRLAFREIYNEIRKQLGGYVGKLGVRLSRLEDDVVQRVKSGEEVSKAVSDAMKAQKLTAGLLRDMQNTMANMAAVGYGTGSGAKVLSEAKRKIIVNKLTNEMWSPDEMKLSKRIHGTSERIRRDIVDTITASIRSADTVREMAKKLYDGYNSGRGVLRYAELPQYLKRMQTLALLAAHGDKNVTKELDKAIAVAEGQIKKLETKELKMAYGKLLKVCKSEEFKEKYIERAAYVAVQEKSRYHAMRIARTESQRAWFQGLMAKYQADPLVFGYKWRLSSRHKYVPYDQCDVCANMDVGFGKGIYYKNRMPLIPVHPHCMCMAVPVFITDIEKGSRYRPERAREYIDSLPEEKKKRLFGLEGAAAYEKGGDWQRLLRGFGGLKNPHTVLREADFIDGTMDTVKRRLSEKLEYLTEEEKAALTSYTGNTSAAINGRLARGEPLKQYAGQVELLDSALEKGEITHDITVYRKTIPEFIGAFGRDLLTLKGATITENKYISTCLEEFEYPGRNVFMKITVSKGFKGALYIRDLAHDKYKHQTEVLFKRGLKIAINNVRHEAGIYYIEAELRQ